MRLLLLLLMPVSVLAIGRIMTGRTTKLHVLLALEMTLCMGVGMAIGYLIRR
jgi:hypothetical protein